jgi:hypothetical protein
MALAIAVTTRLWLGGVLSNARAMEMAVALAWQVKVCALCRPLLVCLDGFVAYISAFRRVFRTPLREGRVGQPTSSPLAEPGLGPGDQAVRPSSRGGHRAAYPLGRSAPGTRPDSGQPGAWGPEHGLHRTLASHLSELPGLSGPKEPQPGAHREDPGGRHVFGWLCLQLLYLHEGLRLPLYISAGRHERRHWVRRTPAMAAGLTDHRWTVQELLNFKVPPPLYVPPKRRGRPPKVAVLA